MNPPLPIIAQRRRLRTPALLLLFSLVAGCESATYTVSGRVLYKDKPVPGGWVMFAPKASGVPPSRAAIDEQGRYELTVRAGEVQILVDNQELAPVERPPPPQMPGDLKAPPGGGKVDGPRPPTSTKPNPRYVEIPPIYYKFETSGLKYTVKPENQTYDIELK